MPDDPVPDSVPVSAPGSASEAAIRLEGVSLRYPGGPAVLSEACFALEEGGFVFLQGPSGAGKSTLLRYLRMELPAESGRGFLFGRDLAQTGRAERARLRRCLGLVFQDFRLVPWLSALENVCLPLRIAGRDEREARAEGEELLGWVGLAGREGALPDRLSGGERQCVAIARAVIARPRFILADEPTGSVDAATARRLLHLFLSLQREGTGVLFATHDDALVERLGHPRLCLEGGRAVWRAGAAAGVSVAGGGGQGNGAGGQQGQGSEEGGEQGEGAPLRAAAGG